MIRSVVLVGAGNVAWSMGKALRTAGLDILQVVNRSLLGAEALGQELGVSTTCRAEEVVRGADLYLIMVRDDAISVVSQGLPFRDGLVVHTAGSVPMQILSAHQRHGVLYPLQTFSKSRLVDFSRVSLFVEGSTPEVCQDLCCFARQLSPMVYEAGTEQRQWLHLSAVWGANFVNHLWGLASDMLREHGLPTGALHLLMDECLRKAIESENPHRVQTGPAVRFDQQVLDKHLLLLSGDPRLEHLYRMLSQSIQTTAYDLQTKTS